MAKRETHHRPDARAGPAGTRGDFKGGAQNDRIRLHEVFSTSGLYRPRRSSSEGTSVRGTNEGAPGRESKRHRLPQEARPGQHHQGCTKASLAGVRPLQDNRQSGSTSLMNIIPKRLRFQMFALALVGFSIFIFVALYAPSRPAKAAPVANSSSDRGRTLPALFRPGSQRSR